MKCVLLAAGIGKRLRPMTAKTPKCLLKIGGMPILAMTIENLLSNDVTDVAIVTGFMAPKVRLLVRKTFPRLSVTFIHNAKYASTNNAYSLLLARPFVETRAMLLLDSDILFSASLLNVASSPLHSASCPQHRSSLLMTGVASRAKRRYAGPSR